MTAQHITVYISPEGLAALGRGEPLCWQTSYGSITLKSATDAEIDRALPGSRARVGGPAPIAGKTPDSAPRG